MPISWNEIRTRAYAFVHEWQGETNERAEAKSFWGAFFDVFGVSRRRVATFEANVKKEGEGQGYIDLLWKGKLLIEHKSRGRDLDRAHQQAIDYFPGLKDEELPQYIIVCDFERFRVYDLDAGDTVAAEFLLKELPENLEVFDFIAGYQRADVKPEDPVNIEAAEKMARLHDQLKDAGYRGHNLEILLVRLLFCLFAEDTGVFERSFFRDLLINHTREDGSDLGMALAQLFQVLNTPVENRQTTLPQHFSDFTYINGKLFEEHIDLANFNSEMRGSLLDATTMNWGKISPAIFGSLFQGVLDVEIRRALGAHYTSETNILKVVRSLFLNDLWEEFERTRTSLPRLRQFHQKLAGLKFLDPACGCGNFLVIAYRELRLLELDVLKVLSPTQLELDISQLTQVNVDQFYGIEIEEFPAQIAQIALWLTDHQMNLKTSETFGKYYARLPLTRAPNIVHGNALAIPWSDVIPPADLDFILGNPPFSGSKYQTKEQRAEVRSIAGRIRGAGILDYVAAWFLLAAEYIKDTHIEVGFVSTNSITQGEQVGVLWPPLLEKSGISINFAHRTFQWKSEARGAAAVHCVIIGFSRRERREKILFEYDSPKSDPKIRRVKNINPYLVEGPSIAPINRNAPLCDVPPLVVGNKPIDGGHYLFTPEEKAAFLEQEPKAAAYFRKWIGANEFLNGIERWCLWLGNCPPDELRQMPMCMERVRLVKETRLASTSESTRKLAETPTRFHINTIPSVPYLVIPGVSSERREYIPIGFEQPETLASNLVNVLIGASIYHFGVLSSTMHMAWMRYVAGRLESRYRYSIGIVYNNFPWPEAPSKRAVSRIESCAQAVLAAQKAFPNSTLADLYDPNSMPPTLRLAHRALDKAVDVAYRRKAFQSETQRVEFLFDQYAALTCAERSQEFRQE